MWWSTRPAHWSPAHREVRAEGGVLVAVRVATKGAILVGFAAPTATAPEAVTAVAVAEEVIDRFLDYEPVPASRRGFLALPEKARSKIGLGSKRSSLATTPICQGITR